MKDEPIWLARGYVAALRKHLAGGGGSASLESALRLGRQTVAAGLETLDLARIHEQAFMGLLTENGSTKLRAVTTRRAGTFFKQANAPIEQTQRAAAQAKVRMSQLTETLSRRTAQLAAANRRLQRGAVERKIMEKANEKRRVLHKECLDESLRLQKRLRGLTHRALTAQEDDRKTISHELQDEIAQTLLGINVRLLTLQKEARGRTKRFKNDIASTQRLVIKSATSVRRAARKFAPHEPQAPDLVAPLPRGAENPSQRGRPGKPGGGARAGQ